MAKCFAFSVVSMSVERPVDTVMVPGRICQLGGGIMRRAPHVFVNRNLATGRRFFYQLDGHVRPRLCLATTTARAASLETTRSAVNHQKGDSQTVIQEILNGDSGPDIILNREKTTLAPPGH